MFLGPSFISIDSELAHWTPDVDRCYRKDVLPEHLHAFILQLASPAEMDGEKAKEGLRPYLQYVGAMPSCLRCIKIS